LRYLGSFMVNERSLAYVLVGKDGALIDMGGALSAYGLENIRRGERLGKKLFFLDGLLPLEAGPVFLPRVKTESEISVDIHIFPGDGEDWVLLLDATSEEARERLLQQSTNELSLLRSRLLKMPER
jgi:hypothetical protein